MLAPLLVPLSVGIRFIIEITPSSMFFPDVVKTSLEKEGKQTVASIESKAKVIEIDASLERNVVELLCNTLLNLPVSTEDIKDALQKVIFQFVFFC